MTCVFIVNGERRLPTKEEKCRILDCFAECLGYTKQEKTRGEMKENEEKCQGVSDNTIG